MIGASLYWNMSKKSIISDEWVSIRKDRQHMAREKRKARDIRQSRWWKNELKRGICYYCNEKFAPNQLTMDHIVPLSRGGLSNKSNIAVCCKECNNKKKYLTPAEIALRRIKKTTDK